MSVYARVRPQFHLGRDRATWCGIDIHAGVSLLKPGVNAAAIVARVCRRCSKAKAAAAKQPELHFGHQRPTVTPLGNMYDLLAQVCVPRRGEK